MHGLRSLTLRVGSHVSCRQVVRNMQAEAKITALGLKMPAPAVPKGSFVNFVAVGDVAYLSGHLPQVRSCYYLVRL